MYFLDVNTAVESLGRMWVEFCRGMPTDVHVATERVGDTIEDTTGALTGSWTGGVVNPSVGLKAEAYSAPSGAVGSWSTNTVLDGKRLRGRTFIVPLAQSSYQADGAVAAGYATVATAAMAQFVIEQGASAVVWHRPYPGRAATLKLKARPAHIGGHGLITAGSVKAKAAVLRSRRD